MRSLNSKEGFRQLHEQRFTRISQTYVGVHKQIIQYGPHQDTVRLFVQNRKKEPCELEPKQL